MGEGRHSEGVLRAAELARQEREASKSSKKEREPTPAAEPAAPEPQVKDREPVPA